MKNSLVWMLFATACTTIEIDPTEGLATIDSELNGDTWLQSDRLQLEPYASRYEGVAFGSQHQVFIVGTSYGGDRWVIRKSTNGGITFSSGPTFDLGGGELEQAEAHKIAVDSSGRILVAGTAMDASERLHVVTRLSTDQGATFSTVDELVFHPGVIRGVSSLVVDASGQFTVAINGIDVPTILRRSKPGALTWTTLPNPASNVKLYGLCTTSGGLVATGRSELFGVTGTTYRWTNNLWTRIDTFEGASSVARDSGSSCLESEGALYVGGHSNHSWIVRRSTDGGATWSTVDSVPSTDQGLRALCAGPHRRIYAVGFIEDWAVRRTSNGTEWVYSDLAPDRNANASDCAYNAATGALIVVGSDDSTGVRRLSID
jgi:hypothetical protein